MPQVKRDPLLLPNLTVPKHCLYTVSFMRTGFAPSKETPQARSRVKNNGGPANRLNFIVNKQKELILATGKNKLLNPL